MPVFRYRAVTDEGEVVEGDMEADSPGAVTDRLQDLGYFPLRAERSTQTSASAFVGRAAGVGLKVDRKAVVLMTRELASLLGAGLSLERSLGILAELADRKDARALVDQLLASLREGSSFADALARHPRSFPSYYVALARAGEMGGTLEQVLERLATFLDKAQATRDQIQSALIYPCILLVMAGLAVAVLLTVVVPEFQPLFDDAGEALPTTTRILITVSQGLSESWWVIALGILVLALLLRRGLQDPDFRHRWDSMTLGIPLFGGLVRRIEVARFARTLGTLLQNGVALLGGLMIVKDTLANSALSRTVESVANGLKEGQGLAEPLQASGAFPALATQMIRVGEETGELPEMLFKVAELYDREAQTATERLLALLVPALTIGLGLVIATIIASVLSAILSINQLAF